MVGHLDEGGGRCGIGLVPGGYALRHRFICTARHRREPFAFLVATHAVQAGFFRDVARYEGDHDHAVVFGQAHQDVVGDIAHVVAHGKGRGMAEDDWSLRHVQGVPHGRRGNVGQVHQHAQAVHLPDHLFPEFRQAVDRHGIGRRIGPWYVAAVGQGHVPDPQLVKHAERAER